MSLEKAIQKLTQVIQAEQKPGRMVRPGQPSIAPQPTQTPIEYGDDGQMRPLYDPAMSPVRADHPVCNTSYAKGTRNYCVCTQFAAGNKCCYKDATSLACSCLVNRSTPEQPSNYTDEQYDCNGFGIGISNY